MEVGRDLSGQAERSGGFFRFHDARTAGDTKRGHHSFFRKSTANRESFASLVVEGLESRGVEPLTSSLRTTRSTN